MMKTDESKNAVSALRSHCAQYSGESHRRAVQRRERNRQALSRRNRLRPLRCISTTYLHAAICIELYHVVWYKSRYKSRYKSQPDADISACRNLHFCVTFHGEENMPGDQSGNSIGRAMQVWGLVHHGYALSKRSSSR